MKALYDYITEDFTLNKKGKISKTYEYHPKDRDELMSLLEQLLQERGKDANLNDIDVSNIKDMSLIFRGLDPHNIDISEWNVSSVKDMYSMFEDCQNFNCDLSKWDVSKVEDMYAMFSGCKKINCDLSDWDVSNVEDMRHMFAGCTSLKNKPAWYKE